MSDRSPPMGVQAARAGNALNRCLGAALVSSVSPSHAPVARRAGGRRSETARPAVLAHAAEVAGSLDVFVTPRRYGEAETRRLVQAR
jgi:hypothetical protein